MDGTDIIIISQEALAVMLKVSWPILLIALGVGLIISLIQALTQLQESSLSFVPKLFAVFIALFFLMPHISNNLQTLFEHIIQRIAN